MAKIFFLEQTDSTMEHVKRNLSSLNSGDIVWANSQTAGKGSRGRKFFSPEGGLYFSILLNPINEEVFPYITPLAAVAVRSALEKQFNVSALIKWVNDIYLNEKKVCGILCERIFNSVIIGIGINLSPPKNGFPDDLKEKAGTVCDFTQTKQIKEKFLDTFKTVFFSLYNDKCENVLSQYKKYSLLINKTVTVETSNGLEKGIVSDFTEYGHMILKKENSTSVICSGTVIEFYPSF